MRGVARYKQTPDVPLWRLRTGLGSFILTRFLYANRFPLRSKTLWLLVHPDVFVTIAVIGAVGHDGNVLDVRLPAGSGAGVEDDGAGHVFLQFLVDVPDQLLALGDVGLLRLLVEQLFDLLVAIVGVVTLGTAGVVLVEGLIGIVDGVAGEVQPERIILARDLWKPLRGIDDLEFTVDIDALDLIDQDDGGIAVDRNVTSRYLDLQMLVRTIAGPLHQLARFLAVGIDVGAVAGDRFQHFLRHRPL